MLLFFILSCSVKKDVQISKKIEQITSVEEVNKFLQEKAIVTYDAIATELKVNKYDEKNQPYIKVQKIEEGVINIYCIIKEKIKEKNNIIVLLCKEVTPEGDGNFVRSWQIQI